MDSPGFGTPAGGAGGGQKRARAQNIVPVQVMDIQQSTDENLKVEGLEAGMIILVGQVRGIDAQATKITYNIEDNSGAIDAVYWKEVSQQLSECLIGVK